ncbi:hypothetical protein M9Y10_021670 [Tritrichomonas musculus]|mgnify:CR=1 FL=1|uniref:Uncharacterized protein n=1 Tax=Tritrichomonas musculus TaxID=1915356 RepID=A0ABR2KR00_9EUKA
MSQSGFAPTTEQFLSQADMDDPNVKLIFIQHGKDISTEEAVEAYNKLQKNATMSNIAITELPETPVYPVSFGNGQLHVSRKIDQYIIATPITK